MRNDLRALLLVVFGAFALCALITKSHVTSWNDASRFATIDSLANRGTFAIEASNFSKQTSDTYRYGGHVYSHKPPALSAIGAAVAVALKAAGITAANSRSLWLYLITLLVIGPWFALGCGYAFAIARALGYASGIAVLSAALSGVATLNLPYATVFTNHVPCGAAALAGLYHLYRVRDGTVHACAAGFFLALAFLFDEAAAVVVLMAFIMLYRARRADVLMFLSVSIPLVVIQLVYNWNFSGALIPPGMNDRYWSGPLGTSFDLRTMHDYLSSLAYVTIGGKGLFLYTPLTIVCAYGLFKLRQSGSAEVRRLALAVIATSALYFVFIVVFTNDWFAANYGERRFVDIFFILCTGLAPALASLRGRAAGAALAAAVLSMVMAALGTVDPFAGQADVPGYVSAAGQFAQLARRSPLQAGLDICALIILVALVIRFWPKPAGTRQASPPLHAAK